MGEVSSEKGFSKWSVLIITSLSIFIIVIDTTMMNVSISALVADLDTTVNGVQGAITLYAVVIAALTLSAAKLADIWGIKRVFVGGVAIYGIGTTMAAMSINLPMLVLGWSILEGVGAAMMMPTTINYITRTYSGKDKVLAFGLWGGIGGAGAAFGPIVGGFFTSYYTWRLGFLMEVVIVLVIVALQKYLREYPPVEGMRFDILGALLSGSAMVFSTLGVLMIDPLGQTPAGAVIGLGVGLFVLFLLYERRRMRAGKDPLIDLNLFKSRAFTIGNLVSLFFQMTLAGVMFTIPVYVQLVMRYSAIATGITLMPLSISMFIFSLLGNKLLKVMTPKRAIQLGIVLTMLGIFLLWRNMALDMSLLDFAPGLTFYGIGLGIIFSQITDLSMSGAKPSQYSEASGFFNSQKQYAYSLGTALIGIILVLGLIGGITNTIYESGKAPDIPKEVIKDRVIEWVKMIKQGDLQIPPEYVPIVDKITDLAAVDAMKAVMIFMIIVLVIGLIISIWLPSVHAKKQ